MARMNREKRGHRLVLFVKTHRWMSTCKWQNDSFRSLTLTRPIYTCPYIHAHNLLPRTLRSTNYDIIRRGFSFNQKFLHNNIVLVIIFCYKFMIQVIWLYYLIYNNFECINSHKPKFCTTYTKTNAEMDKIRVCFHMHIQYLSRYFVFDLSSSLVVPITYISIWSVRNMNSGYVNRSLMTLQVETKERKTMVLSILVCMICMK